MTCNVYDCSGVRFAHQTLNLCPALHVTLRSPSLGARPGPSSVLSEVLVLAILLTMALSLATRAVCFLSVISLTFASLAFQLEVSEGQNRRHEPRPPVWPGQYQVSCSLASKRLRRI